MFDTFIQPRAVTEERYISVTEKRAPTDESVRLLSEFEKAASSKIVSAQRLDNNLIDATLWTMVDHLSYKKKFKILISLNGQKIDTDLELDADLSDQEVLESIYSKVSSVLTARLMSSIERTVREK